jgi:Na+-driven multidrug efflux pump
MRVFTNDAELVSYGAKYQRVISVTYLFMGLSQMYLASVKSMEKARFSAIVSSSSLILNIMLNAAAIYILFPGDPEKAIAGVAAATVVARFVELSCCVIYSLRGGNVGNGDLETAKKAGKKIYVYALVFGILAGITILLIRPLVFSLISINANAQVYLNAMLFVCAVYCIGKSVNSTIIGAIFPAGGDAKFGFWCDVIVMWGIIIPLGFLCAFVWRVPPVVLYIVLCGDEFIKGPAAIIRFFQYRWLKNITRDF